MTQIAISDVKIMIQKVGDEIRGEIRSEIGILRKDLGLSAETSSISKSRTNIAQPADLPGVSEAVADGAGSNSVEAGAPGVVEAPQPRQSLRQENLPSCKQLVERLREPLVQLLADSLATTRLPKELPVQTVGFLARAGVREQECEQWTAPTEPPPPAGPGLVGRQVRTATEAAEAEGRQYSNIVHTCSDTIRCM